MSSKSQRDLDQLKADFNKMVNHIENITNALNAQAKHLSAINNAFCQIYAELHPENIDKDGKLIDPTLIDKSTDIPTDLPENPPSNLIEIAKEMPKKLTENDKLMGRSV